MLRRKVTIAIASIILLAISNFAAAGVDASGPVDVVQVSANGDLNFRMQAINVNISNYCKGGWYGLNMFVPKGHPEYPYYYAMVMTAATKAKNLYVANVGIYNGTTVCDITKTGYGLVLVP
jgi:hypothetical protein